MFINKLVERFHMF